MVTDTTETANSDNRTTPLSCRPVIRLVAVEKESADYADTTDKSAFIGVICGWY